MALVKKNIWTLFYLIFIIGSLVLGAILFSLYKNTKNEYRLEQKNITNIASNSVHSVLLQYETILDILGHQLSDNDNYLSKKNSQIILDKLLVLNPSISAFGLAHPNGQLYLTSSNLQVKKLPNLLKKEVTKESFLATLNSENMVLGRTYWFDRIKSLIIPIRKSIRNKKGEVVAVMTAGINVKNEFTFFDKTEHNLLLFRDLDNHIQFSNHHNGAIYKNPIDKKFTDSVFDSITNKYLKTVDSIKKDEEVISVAYREFKTGIKMQASIKYLNEYKIWVVTKVPESVIVKDIYKQSILFVILYLIVNSIMFILFRNIYNAEQSKQNALYYQATHDYLTKLHNRFFLSKEFSKLDKNRPFSMFFIDMDNFKSINDNYGHDYGDLLLKEIAKRLTTIEKERDVLVRYSGDEFILISYISDTKKIASFAQEIIAELSRIYFIKQYQFILGASIGVSRFPEDGKDFDTIKRYADIAMYEAKKDKNTYKLFENSIKNKYARIAQIEQELKKAMGKDEIYMMYQPQVDKDGKLHGVEALVRWENEKLGFVGPDEFISIAETTGMMTKLGKHIISTSLHEIRNLQQKLEMDFQLSINISVKQFMEIDFFDKLIESIQASQFNKLQVTLEVTENIFIEDLDFILELLNRLKKENIYLSLDDFGTGYSSLSLLKELPIDELKIDKSFVDDILVDSKSLHMIKSVISIGKNLNMTILAEGVETVEQKEFLVDHGCHLFQGFYYSKPLKINELESYIKKN